MAKKSMIEREKKRIKLNNKYKTKRQNLLNQYETTEDFNLKLEIHAKIQKFPKPVENLKEAQERVLELNTRLLTLSPVQLTKREIEDFFISSHFSSQLMKDIRPHEIEVLVSNKL